jgi:hypothetical protein
MFDFLNLFLIGYRPNIFSKKLGRGGRLRMLCEEEFVEGEITLGV